MVDALWPRGSEWRKWDLHVHSPASGNYRGDYNQFIIQLGNADCDVIGINDYFSVAGFREIQRRLSEAGSSTEGNKAYREALEKLRSKTLLPVIECRMTNVLVDKKGKGQRINFHLIFDPSVAAEDIETFLKSQHVKGSSIGSRYSDKDFLLNDVAVDFNTALQALQHDGSFKGRYLVWLPYDEYGGIDRINPCTDKLFKENLIFSADILGSSNRKQADFFLWKDTTYTEAQYRDWFGKRKPCIKGSDSHDVNDEVGKLKDHTSQPTDKYCWIKADPTFQGLQQVINEPEDRVHIGPFPPKLAEVRANATRFIDSIRIFKTETADSPDTWFDCELPLNTDMVVIIGNKGSGKSALADILALVGNTHCDPIHFSFLNKQRFCDRNGKLARQFEARATWKDGTAANVLLNAKPDINDVELVRYIPQTYLEKVCTETEPGQQSEFQIELRKVIFSHISEADRLNKETLDELIAYKTEELESQIENTRREISKVNTEIVRLEEKSTAAHLAQLAAQLKVKQQELKAHEENRPAKVEPPSNVSAEQKAAIDTVALKLAQERTALSEVDTQIAQQQSAQKTLTEKVAGARKVEGRIENFKSEFERLERETALDLKRLGLDFKEIVSLKIDPATLTLAKKNLSDEKAKVEIALSPEAANSLPARRILHLSRLQELQNQLDAPNKLYQKFNESLRDWQARTQAIIGDEQKPDTLKWLEAQIKYINEDLPAEIGMRRAERRKLAEELHKCVAKIRDAYRELFAAVQDLISASVIIKEGFKLTFESSIAERAFEADFFERHVSQGNVGSFYGKEKGAAVLEELKADFDFNHVDDAIAFVEKIVAFLQCDMRNPQKPKTEISAQLRKGVDVKMLYDFLWSFGYLKPEYSLKLDGKDLTHLSPGERGTLLLVFYLLVDKTNKPIIVDQPEENLDSQTVYRLLIPVIKDVKKRRQIIMVTHSPNIAVVCDAEQIVHAHIDRSAGNKVIYTSGSIECATLNRHVVNVLEGTRPAFDNREAKYYAQ